MSANEAAEQKTEMEENALGNREKVNVALDNGHTAAAAGPADDAGDEGYATLQKPMTNGGKRLSGSSISVLSTTMDTDERRSDEPVKLSFEKGRPSVCNRRFDWQHQAIIASLCKQVFFENQTYFDESHNSTDQ